VSRRVGQVDDLAVRRASTRSQIETLRSHVLELANANDVEVEISRSKRSQAIGREEGDGPRIIIREIRSQITYLIAHHELAHLVAPDVRAQPRLEREATAWCWALAQSRVTPMLQPTSECANNSRRTWSR